MQEFPVAVESGANIGLQIRDTTSRHDKDTNAVDRIKEELQE